MRAIEIKETESGIVLRSRVLPAALKAFYFLAFIGFVGWGLWKIWPQIQNRQGSWLPPFNALPDYIKSLIIYACIGSAFLICFVALFRELKILLLGENWEMDVSRQIVLKNGKLMCNFHELATLIIEGDFYEDYPTLRMYFLTQDNKKLHIAEGISTQTQLKCFLEAGSIIFRRAHIPYRKTLTSPFGLKQKAPAWWDNIS